MNFEDCFEEHYGKLGLKGNAILSQKCDICNKKSNAEYIETMLEHCITINIISQVSGFSEAAIIEYKNFLDERN